MPRKGPGAKSGMGVQYEAPGEVPAYRSWEGRDMQGMCRGHTLFYLLDEQQDQDSGDSPSLLSLLQMQGCTVGIASARGWRPLKPSHRSGYTEHGGKGQSAPTDKGLSRKTSPGVNF